LPKNSLLSARTDVAPFHQDFGLIIPESREEALPFLHIQVLGALIVQCNPSERCKHLFVQPALLIAGLTGGEFIRLGPVPLIE
jgi:hypothetical protein